MAEARPHYHLIIDDHGVARGDAVYERVLEGKEHAEKVFDLVVRMHQRMRQGRPDAPAVSVELRECDADECAP